MANPEDNNTSVAGGNRPAFGCTLILLLFYLFIMINLAYLSSVRIVLTLVTLICDLSFLHMLNLVAPFVMIYILLLIWKLPNMPTKQLHSFHGTTRAKELLMFRQGGDNQSDPHCTRLASGYEFQQHYIYIQHITKINDLIKSATANYFSKNSFKTQMTAAIQGLFL
jgi:hypothetical protein